MFSELLLTLWEYDISCNLLGLVLHTTALLESIRMLLVMTIVTSF